MKRIARLLMLASLAAAAPVHAATFVKDVMLIGGNESETTALKTSYAAQGWTVIDQDLNAGAGGDYRRRWYPFPSGRERLKAKVQTEPRNAAGLQAAQRC